MSAIDTILTNTILVPASDGLVDSNQLPSPTIVTDLQKFNTNFDRSSALLVNQFKVFLKTSEKSVYAGFCSSVADLKVSRQTETKRTGGNGDYMVRLPGSLKYNPIVLVHLVTDNKAFLDWLINGADHGGIQKADIEIRVGTDDDYMCYTLRDAFPTSWNFGTMSINVNGLVTNTETVTYSIKNGDVMIENLTVVYSKLEYQRVGG